MKNETVTAIKHGQFAKFPRKQWDSVKNHFGWELVDDGRERPATPTPSEVPNVAILQSSPVPIEAPAEVQAIIAENRPVADERKAIMEQLQNSNIPFKRSMNLNTLKKLLADGNGKK